jgi:hypothetical protein
MREWLQLSCDRSVVLRGFAFSAIVGTILVVVNHGDALMNGDVSTARVMKIVITMLIPYCVSTVSSVGAMQTARREQRRTTSV